MAKPEAICSIDGCERTDRIAFGMCSMHYQRWKRNGDPLTTRIFLGTVADRLLHYTDERGPSDCWPWTGTLTTQNYSQVSVEGSTSDYAYRLIWERENGPIPQGMTIDHECHNRAVARGECDGGTDCVHRRCVNPAHLVARPIGENTLGGNSPSAVNARKTRCKWGHPLNGANLMVTKDGRRQCRTCKRARWHKWKANRDHLGRDPSRVGPDAVGNDDRGTTVSHSREE